MQYENFQKAQDFQARIKNLEIFREKLVSSFKQQPMSAKLEVNFLGNIITYPMAGIQDNYLGDYINSEDGKCILDAIDNKITEIKKEFETL